MPYSLATSLGSHLCHGGLVWAQTLRPPSFLLQLTHLLFSGRLRPCSVRHRIVRLRYGSTVNDLVMWVDKGWEDSLAPSGLVEVEKHSDGVGLVAGGDGHAQP